MPPSARVWRVPRSSWEDSWVWRSSWTYGGGEGTVERGTARIRSRRPPLAHEGREDRHRAPAVARRVRSLRPPAPVVSPGPPGGVGPGRARRDRGFGRGGA